MQACVNIPILNILGLYLSQLYYDVHQVQDFLLVQMPSSVIKQVRNRDFVFNRFIKCLLPGAQGAGNNNLFVISVMTSFLTRRSIKGFKIECWKIQVPVRMHCENYLQMNTTGLFASNPLTKGSPDLLIPVIRYTQQCRLKSWFSNSITNVLYCQWMSIKFNKKSRWILPIKNRG